MLELNVYSAVLVPTVCLAVYAVYAVRSRLREPAEYRRLSSRVPSVTKTLWTEIAFSWTLGNKSHKDILPFISDVLKKNGPIVHFNLIGRAYVLLNDPKDIKVLLTSAQNLTKGPEYDMLIPWLNEGLLITSGRKWQSRRKLLANTFHVKTLDTYGPSMNRHARVLAGKLLKACAADGEGISVAEYVTLCSLDMICETIMDSEINAQEGKSREYVDSIKSACRSLVERAFKFWLWNDLVFRMSASGRSFYKAIDVLHDFTDNVRIRAYVSITIAVFDAKTYDIIPNSLFSRSQRNSWPYPVPRLRRRGHFPCGGPLSSTSTFDFDTIPSELPVSPDPRPLSRIYLAVKHAVCTLNQVIRTKRATLNNESRSQNVQPEADKRRRAKSFLDLLLDISKEQPEQMTDSDIREEVDTFLFAGHDTSSISITMTLLLLGMHPDVQDRVREEAFGVFGDSDRDATADDLHAMPYLEAVIKESLRLYPSVPAFTRVLDTTLRLENYNIPPKTVVAVYPYVLHRNEDVYPDPEKFVPERFLDDKTKFAFAYLPFSAGSRNCIGQKYAMSQMKTVVSTVVRMARIETLGTVEDVQVNFQIVIRIESAPKMKFYAV